MIVGDDFVPREEIEVTIKIGNSVASRKLKTLWNLEAVLDLSSYAGIDAVTELLAVTAKEITNELDFQTIAKMLSKIAFKETP